MRILILDELRNLRPPAYEVLVNDPNTTVVVNPTRDLRELHDRNAVEILGFSSTFYDWELPTQVLDLFPNLRYLCISGGWHEYVDLGYCENRGITVTYVPGFSSPAAAEWCLMATLILARKVPQATQEGASEVRPGFELCGRTAGIVGLGGVGRRLAGLATSVGMSVIYWSPTSRDNAFHFSDLDEIMKSADCVYLTFYEADDLVDFVDRRRIDLMGSEALLISGLGSQPGLASTAVDWAYAIDKVRRGTLGGVAIECGEGELARPAGNVFVSPGHTGWCTRESLQRGTSAWISNIIGAREGKPLCVLRKQSREEGH